MANIDLMVLAGDYVKTAVISEWKVKVGDKVKKGDVLLEVETNKVVQGIESPCDGIVEQILFDEGDDVEISKTVAVVGDGSGQAAKAPEAAQAKEKTRTVISPVAKKMAAEMGIDLEALAARYPGKRISKNDVLEFANEAETAAPAAAPEPAIPEPASAAAAEASVTEIPVKGLRRSVGAAMRASAYSKPHVTMQTDAEFDGMLKMKAYLKAKYPDRKITVTGLLALAVRSALKECPYMNGTATEEVITLSDTVNLGIAVDVEGGLMVPVVRNCSAMSGFELFEAVNSVAKGCREGTLGPSSYAGGTFTISNVGSGSVRYFTPIINAPEIAILGVGSPKKELFLKDGEICEHTLLGLSLSFDHSAVDGAPAARFLGVLKEKIENPFMMAL